MSLTLIQLRQQIVEQNGRYDLTDGSWADNGIDYYINAGLRYLDNHQLSPKSHAWYKQDFVIDDFRMKVQNLLSIKEVWMVTTASDRWQLTKRALGYMMETYYKYSIAVSDSGIPIDFCMAVPRLAPEQKDLTTLNYDAEFTYGWENILFADEDSGHFGYRLISWMPKADTAGTIEILGVFQSDPLTANGQYNFWTKNYEEVVIEATNLMLEHTYRNTQGVNDRMLAITDLLTGVDHNLVEEDISSQVQMEE
ncbi:hypothetical protein LCGC14_1967520 [marine sediment metagenome]|uniref:Uncharacterized protein n=1 Tax=marine sediment metagenome TaxID=412755 RepID=A0A0F9I9P7_9ZZZZ